MVEPQIVRRQDFVVAMDYGQFSLRTADIDPDLALTLLGQGQSADGIAQAGGLVVVESPHQNSFEMPLTVEVWDRHPSDDLDEWQEAFEAHLDVTDGLMYESPTVDEAEIDVPPGAYHALITGRGFVAHGWPGSAEPGDAWRIQLWPSTGPDSARRLRAFVEPDGEQNSENDAGREQRSEQARRAGLRIKADLDRAPSARALAGELSTAVVDSVVAGKIARYWFLAANLDVMGMRSGGSDAVVGDWFRMYPHEGEITGTGGSIRCEWTELTDPSVVALLWQWCGPNKVPRPKLLSTLRVQFVDATPPGGDPVTRIHLEHGQVPIEWTDDLTKFWGSRIDTWVWQVGHAANWRGSGR